MLRRDDPIIVRPAGAKPWPLIMGLHGFTENAAKFQEYSGLDQIAKNLNCMVCYANAAHQPPLNEPNWINRFLLGGTDRDTQYFDQLIPTLLAECNSSKLIWIGFSDGATEAVKMGLLSPETLLIIPYAGMPMSGQVPDIQRMGLEAMVLRNSSDPLVKARTTDRLIQQLLIYGCNVVPDATDGNQHIGYRPINDLGHHWDMAVNPLIQARIEGVLSK